jgi:hypothetical protein
VSRRVKLLLLGLMIMTMPLLAARFQPDRDTPPPPWMPGDGSGGGGATSCSLPCPDGSTAGGACDADEVAHCYCIEERSPDAWFACS